MPGVHQQTETKEQHVNVSVLVYTFKDVFKDGLRDLMFEGNYKEECNLHFDCIFNQRFHTTVNANFFYSMDAVIVGNSAVHFLRKLFPFNVPI